MTDQIPDKTVAKEKAYFISLTAVQFIMVRRAWQRKCLGPWWPTRKQRKGNGMVS